MLREMAALRLWNACTVRAGGFRCELRPTREYRRTFLEQLSISRREMAEFFCRYALVLQVAGSLETEWIREILKILKIRN